MVSAVQAVPNTVTASLSPVVGRFFQVIQGADSSLSTPSVIVSLGNTPTELLVFNAAGVLQVAGTSQDAAGLVSTSTGSANTLLNPVTADVTGTNAATAAVATPIAILAAANEVATPPVPAAAAVAVIPLAPIVQADTGSATIIAALPASTPAPNILDTATTAVVAPTLTPNTPVVPATTTIPASSTTVDQTTLVPALIATALAALAPTRVATPASTVALPAGATTTAAVGAVDTAALLPAATVAVATPAVTAPVAAAVSASDDTTATAQDTVTPLVNTVVDPVVRASINIETNPAYASMAAGLYVSAMIYRTQRAMADTGHSAQPTGPVMPVAAIVANDQERGGDLRRNRSSWMR